MCQHVCQLVRLHASRALPVPPGPRALQGPRVRPAQEVQRPGTCLRWTPGQTLIDERDRKRESCRRKDGVDRQGEEVVEAKSPPPLDRDESGDQKCLVWTGCTIPVGESLKAQDWTRDKGQGHAPLSLGWHIGAPSMTDRTEGESEQRAGESIRTVECLDQSCCCFELKEGGKKNSGVNFSHPHQTDWCKRLKQNEGDESAFTKRWTISLEVVVTAKTNKTFPKCIFVISP